MTPKLILAGLATLALAGPAHAGERPFFDSRAAAARSDAGGRDLLTGTPRLLFERDGALSGRSAASPATIARTYLRVNARALGLGTADVDALGEPVSHTTARGLTIVTFPQSYKGIPAFDNSARVALDREGRVVAVLGSPASNLEVPSVTPKLSAAEAVESVRRSVDGSSAGDPADASLTIFGGTAGPVLAWDLTYEKDSLEHYHAIVDAGSGELLLRANRVRRADDALVYPLAPGFPPGPAQAFTFPDGWLDAGATTLDGAHAHTWTDLDDDDVVDPGEAVTRTAAGDFRYPLTDLSAQVMGRVGPAGCSVALCTWDSAVPGSWRANREQNAVQAFYLVNRFRDHLANTDAIGFRPPFSFERTQGDAVQVHANDGSATQGGNEPDFRHLSNASMFTPPQGQAPRMELNLFKYEPWQPFVEFNSGDNALIVWHEYAHGLSSRLITHANGEVALGGPQAGAMGEAWSDWYALDLAEREGLLRDDPDVNGELSVGAASDSANGQVPGGHLSRTQGVDCPVGAGSPDVTTRCPGGMSTGPGGYTLGDFGKVKHAFSAHGNGEIWSETLWDLRRALINHTGSRAAGADLAALLITDGMRLSPPDPSMLEARDAIFAADLANGLELSALLWPVFARRGMGFYASTESSTDPSPIEDFNVPPPADAPTGRLVGTVTDSTTGLGVPGVTVSLGQLRAQTGADGAYAFSMPQGRYTRLTYTKPGYNPDASTSFTVLGGQSTTKDVILDRNWASISGGARISDKSIGADDNGGASCATAAMLGQDPRRGWAASNPAPAPPLPAPEHAPYAVVELPRAIDVGAIGIDPTARCFPDDQTAALGTYRLEVSRDGVSFRPFTGDGTRSFGPADVGRVHRITPDGDAGRDVRYVKITPIAPQDGACDVPCNGRFEVNVGQLEVFGMRPNTPPAGTPAAADAGAPVVLGGLPQATTPGATRAKPKVAISRRGTISVTCAVRCRAEARLVASRATARRHRLPRRLLGRSTLSVATTKRFTVKTSRRVRRLSAALTVRVRYPDGTATVARRTIRGNS